MRKDKNEDAGSRVAGDEDLEMGNEELEEEIGEAEEEDEAGIFDEDLILEEGDSGEDLILEEDDDSDKVSDFFIGDTILSTGNVEQSWSKEDLEEVIRNERIEKDWQDSEEFVGGDFYDAVSGNFYGADSERKDGFYRTERGDDLYKEKSGGDLYNTGEAGVYKGKANEEGVYDVSKRGMKSYDEIVDNRRSGRSMLEMAGFEDKEKQKERDEHRLMDYSAKKAA